MTFQSGLLNVNKFSPQRRSLPSLFTGFGVPVAVPVLAAYSQTGCSFPRNFANFRHNVGILIGSFL